MIYNFDNLSFQILTIVHAEHRVGYFEVERRPYAALSYRLTGNSEFEIMDKKLCAKPGDILFIPANADYKVNYTPNDSIIIHMLNCNYTTPECFSFENKGLAESYFLNLLQNWENTHSVHQAKARIYDILFRLSNENIPIHNETLKKAMEYINKHFSDPELNIARLCTIISASESTLQRLFIRYFAVSPKQYLLKMRLDKAFNLLAEGSLSVKEVAFLCGFTDEKYFSRIFRKKFGYPPSELLKLQSL